MTYTDIPELYERFIRCDQKVTTDTRKIEQGSIFFALKGENFDANTFVSSAIEQGCRYAVTDNPAYANGDTILLVPDVLQALQELAKHHRSALKIPVIGITGSNGKTTNKELIHAVLSKKYKVYATKGNLNNHIGVPLTLLSVTPQHDMAIVEMGANHQGEIAFLSDLADPDYGLITNIGKAHLEGFGGVEGIKKGKSELYKYLRPKKGLVFVNGDDPVLMELAGGMNVHTFGEHEQFDVHGHASPHSEFVAFKWNVKGKDIDESALVNTHMFGHYNFINLLCAAAIGNYFGVLAESINDALANYKPEMNRSQVLKTEKNTLILDAYNANPSSMALAINNFSEQLFPKKLVILGDMFELGDYAQEEHRQILEKLQALKLSNAYLAGELFFEFKKEYPDYHFFRNAIEVGEYLEKHLITEYTVLIKGSRGMRLEGLVKFL
jgi:UDP-N-acetylmuramoyl-tripeptide--D-alanyl-D-alanine ligase